MGQRRWWQVWSRSLGSPPNDTFTSRVTVLVVIRNVTTLNRLWDALPALCCNSLPPINFTFVIDEGSNFASSLGAYLQTAGMTVITWERARRTRWDLIISAHVNRGLALLRGKLVVFAHGAGYSRIVPSSTGSTCDPVGLARKQISRFGRVFPAAIGLSHENQLEQLPADCPEARERAFLMGDPTFDRIAANTARRDIYRSQFGAGSRRVVLVSSTWGPHSSAAKEQTLIHRLVAQLPADEWLVVTPVSSSGVMPPVAGVRGRGGRVGSVTG